MKTQLKKCFLALDNKSKKEVFDLLKVLRQKEITIPIKIGLELFCHYGKEIVQEIHDFYNTDIFLDLKLHDIPNTVSKAIKALNGLPIKWLTIHLAGGEAMARMAQETAKEYLASAQILGVSYLTSLAPNDFKNLWNIENLNDQNNAFTRLFKMAIQSQIPGIVCSAEEISLFHNYFEQLSSSLEIKNRPVIVCPGIRFEEEVRESITQDQKRVQTPETAFSLGADYLVIGRSLQNITTLEARITYLKSLEAN